MSKWETHRLLPADAQHILMEAAREDRQRRENPEFHARYRFMVGSSVDQAIIRVQLRWPQFFRRPVQ